MAFLLFFGVILCNLTCVIIKKKSNIIAFGSTIALALIMAFSSTTFGDLESYAERYGDLNFQYSKFEQGYIEINRIFSTAGFSFDQFRLLIFLVCSILLFFTAKSLTKNYNMVILLYTFSLFYFLSVALRFFIAFSISVFALSILLSKKKRYIIVSLLLILLAAQFHKSVYMVFIYFICLLPKRVLKILNIVLLVFSCLSCLLSVFLVVAPSFIADIANIVKHIFAGLFGNALNDLLESYLDEGYSRRYMIYYAFYALNCFVSVIALTALKKSNKISEDVVSKYQVISFISLAGGFLVVISQTFIRLLFIPIFIGFVFFAKLAEYDEKEPINVIISRYSLSLGVRNSLIILTSLTWFFMLYIIGDLSFDLSWFLSTNKIGG